MVDKLIGAGADANFKEHQVRSVHVWEQLTAWSNIYRFHWWGVEMSQSHIRPNRPSNVYRCSTVEEQVDVRNNVRISSSWRVIVVFQPKVAVVLCPVISAHCLRIVLLLFIKSGLEYRRQEVPLFDVMVYCSKSLNAAITSQPLVQGVLREHSAAWILMTTSGKLKQI